MPIPLDPIDLAIQPMSRATVIPPSWYLDPAMFELEYELIFRRTWQWVGRADQVAVPGAYFTCEVAGEPIVVVRGEDGKLRAFSNVCLHRAGPVAQGEGTLKHFQCAYHRWTYGLDGSLRGTPHFNRAEAFAKEKSCLPRVHVDTWDPFVFVNLDPESRPLSETLGNLPERFSSYRLGDLSFHRQIVLESACNWKVHAENARECYHCLSVHPSSSAAYDVENATVETFDLCSFMFFDQRSSTTSPRTGVEILVPLARDIAEFRRRSPARIGLEGKEKTGSYFIYVFPNFMVMPAPDHMSAVRIIPNRVDRITLVRDFFFDPAAGPEAVARIEDNIHFRMQTIREDSAICEVVQKGLRSRYRKPGRYSSQEVAVYHFHSVLRRFLGQNLTGAKS